MSALLLFLAVIILAGTYVSLPAVAEKIWSVAGNSTEGNGRLAEGNFIGSSGVDAGGNAAAHKYLFPGMALILGLSAISFACYLLGRSALIENEMAIRLSGLADALCIAGGDIAQFEKAAAIFVPKTKTLSSLSMFSPNDLKPLADVLKQLR